MGFELISYYQQFLEKAGAAMIDTNYSALFTAITIDCLTESIERTFAAC